MRARRGMLPTPQRPSPPPPQQPTEHTTKAHRSEKQPRAGSTSVDSGILNLERGEPADLRVPAAAEAPARGKGRYMTLGLGPIISEEQAAADRRERQMSPNTKAAAVAKAVAAAAAAAAAVAPADYPCRKSASSRSTKAATKQRIALKSSAATSLAHSGTSTTKTNTGGSSGTVVCKSRAHSSPHVAPARSKMPLRRKATFPVPSYGQ